MDAASAKYTGAKTWGYIMGLGFRVWGVGNRCTAASKRYMMTIETQSKCYIRTILENSHVSIGRAGFRVWGFKALGFRGVGASGFRA